jgi:hypothetical protein
MQLIRASHLILSQLADAINQVSEEDFIRPCSALGNSTIGQHLRHTVEFFICLEDGFRNGTVNYDKRAHDKLIESDKFIALNALDRIKSFVDNQKKDIPLTLEVGYEREKDECIELSTNYFRELTYNIEHAVHHMALMKIGIHEVAGYVKLPADFGIAVSTLRYNQTNKIASH